MTARFADATPDKGWRANLKLRFAQAGDRTILAERQHEGPLVVQRALYPEGDVCHVIIVHPPGGVVAGDRLSLDVSTGSGAHACLTTPASGKFYRSQGEYAQVQQHLRPGAGVLEWLPQEGIFYPGAKVRLDCRLDLQPDSRFIGWEMACLGLPACDEDFGQGLVRQAWRVELEGRLLLHEQLHLDNAVLAAPWGLSGRSALGTLLAFPGNAQQLAAVRAIEDPDVCIASTCVDGLLIVRGVAARGDRLKRCFVRIWEALRPLMCGRPASLPRIWAS